MRHGIIFTFISFLLLSSSAFAQRPLLNMPEHDDKNYYFGITFGLNYSVYQIHYTESFANTDTFKVIQPKWQPGFNLGLVGNLKLSNFIDLRFVPSLAFAEKRLQFNYGYPKDSASDRTIESIYMHLPLQLKFKSERIKNFRFYAIVGGKFDYDLAANSRSHRPDEFLKVSASDFGYEFGVGFEFFNPNFIFSPEIKMSQGLTNQLFTDRSIKLTNAIEALLTRMIVISIHLEG
jgi:Outer membrane protein beta-barrel domain